MMKYHTLLSVAIQTILFLPYSTSKPSLLQLPNGGGGIQCEPNQFFDHLELLCKDCGPNTIPKASTRTGNLDGANNNNDHDHNHNHNPSECTCPTNHLKDSCSIEQLFSGTCTYPQCSPSSTFCQDQSMGISLDQSTCVTCGTLATFDVSSGVGVGSGSGTCICPSGHKRVEVYNATNELRPVVLDCLECPPGTAVITDKLLQLKSLSQSQSQSNYYPGQQYHMTAGVSFPLDPYVCARCPDPEMIFDEEYNCICGEGFVITGEASVGPQSCIRSNFMPSVSSDYTKVEFHFIETQDKSGAGVGAGARGEMSDTIIIDSIILSHYYLEAASGCEFKRGNSEKTRNACQTLMNLCVLSSYDNTAAACRQLQTISKSRGNLRNRLIYEDDVDDILRDKSLEMLMSFREKEGFVHELEFRLAKFTVDGRFVGFEELDNQFLFPCAKVQSSVVHGNDESMFRFGRPFSVQMNDCSVEEFFERDMYLYELYVVDTKGECGADDFDDGAECLYPIPVLATNLSQDKTFPNVNRNIGDELDDKFVRRFTIFDNVSGRTSNGLQIFRHISNIVLETTVQDDFRSKIYPPVLMIDYAEVKVSNLILGTTVDINYKVEYNMITTNAIGITIGFLSAIALLIWSFRIYNWYNTNRNLTSPSEQAAFAIRVIAIGFHTIVITFLPFIFCLCVFWYTFYILQDSVFLLLPSQNDFRFRTEYLFFAGMITCLFLCQTIYVFFTIYWQCNVDIILLDWEKPQSKHSDVSIWRKVICANEFDKLQATRKTMLEVSLLLVCTISVRRKNSIDNIIAEFAVTGLVWVFSVGVQTLWKSIMERFITENRTQRLLDLMTLSNISMVILNGVHHGYYLNCRCPYEFADVNMKTLCENMSSEAQGILPFRGLDNDSAAGPSCQTYEMFISDVFQKRCRKFYERGYDPNLLTSALEEMQCFIMSFIDQSPSPEEEGMQRIIRPSGIIERILGLVPVEVRGTSEINILSPDVPTWANDYLFLDITFLGIETDLGAHDFLTFSVAELIFHKPYVSAIVTYAMHLIRTSIRRFFGSRNLSRKSFLDARFLST